MSVRRSVLYAAGALFVLSGALFLWRTERVSAADRPAVPSPPLPVETMVVQPKADAPTLDAVGSLEAVRQVTIAPEVAGRVVGIEFVAGTQVRAGQTLVQLYDAPEQAKLAGLQAKVDYTRRQFARAEQLVPNGAEPKATFDARRYELDAARADIRETQAVITQKLIRAPFSGVIGLRRVNLGQYLNPGDAIATLTDLSVLYANFTVPQKELGRVSLGQTVRVTADPYPGRTFEARVTAIEPQVGDETRNITVQATVNNTDQLLRPGMYIDAHVVLQRRDAVISVPDTAVQTSQAGDTVIVVEQRDGRGVGFARVRQVRAGARERGRIVIEDGLRAGDVVVTTGQLRVAPGEKVQTLADAATQRETVR
ncbi:efflux RND transporter periplasmic adaptor subunit [Burkholderia glumae]|uniref:Efflux RND transporter periplasmic adaptor subunit n=1 Tax=Burkholderia glumae TaxID=337 RepID=A0AAP9XZG0_BURGL|nr:efflux RND transporter periplasmic adaptor subunit [Burkholderia glumae]ACR30616.1 RND family efflux transporter MFP subunit [Burkholderia glumae BGR1]KHJ64981.1 hemolysin secretion protein D [Burkholderia glumae]MCM2484093.1 efflux RND transporter periplasmic adaptor subunit [Burkholderia glumae]MCM2509783.1 efflux RND transporter periplasmic adaptor subunit [Burkholderia glumae]MCM2539546.1 efflux RND transporter periplasmic adaptor subunit [Burkholderia glumae]